MSTINDSQFLFGKDVPVINNVLISDNVSISSFVETGFLLAFITSFTIIVMSEIGDKTFFIAALMAMKHHPLVVLLGSAGALAVMTVLSAGVGSTVLQVVDRRYTQYASLLLFVFFGIRMLRDAYHMDASGEVNEELEEVEAVLNKKQDPESPSVAMTDKLFSPDTKSSRVHQAIPGPLSRFLFLRVKWRKFISYLNPVLVQAFSLTFLAEWGDRSQIATIALAASRDAWGVNLGAILGHTFCTGIAVTGGKLLASSISERVVASVGGVLFLVFATVGLFFGS